MPRFERRIPAVAPRGGLNPFTREQLAIPGRPAYDEAVDISLDGVTVATVRSKPGKKPKTKREVFANEEAARGHYATAIRKLSARGYREKRAEPARASSALLVEELLGEASPRFLDELALFSGKKLATIAERWSNDTRPEARRMLLDYVNAGCDRPGHKLLVKRLLSLAEKRQDDELMATFAVAFDRMEKRWLVERESWDWSTREMQKERALVGSPLLVSNVQRDDATVFSTRTRHHLCRRAFRYFRQLAYRDATRYELALAPALARYTDEDLAEPSRFLDAWSLVHVLYWGSDVLIRDPRGIRIASGSALSDLTFSPFKAEIWSRSFDTALDLAESAQSRPVARFAVHLLREHHAPRMKRLSFAIAKRLLGAAHEETRAYMVEQLDDVSDLDKVPVTEWLSLIDGGSLETLPTIVRLFRKHVAPKRLSLEECVTLALSPAGAVAELGLAWVKERAGKGIGSLERQRLLRLLSARAPLVRKAAADYVAELLSQAPEAKPEEVRELLDAGDADVRARGMSLLDEVPRFSKSPVVWASMAESPHNDVREKLVGELFARATQIPRPVHPDGPKLDEGALARLWSTTLLSIHRGGRAKPKALLAMAQTLVEHPARAEDIVPLLRIALRSVRPSERRAALGAVTRAAQASADVRAALSRHLPELDLGSIDTEVVA
ncbi:MAG: hypothetical protein HOW73_35800 [Polyangiaceae bacterium]|nr:hypothetical protein [Polyangiaceae bacterium]